MGRRIPIAQKYRAGNGAPAEEKQGKDASK
jgi:hypothetical protein